MLTYTDFCLKLAKIIKDEKIESQSLKTLVDETIDQLDRQQPPIDAYVQYEGYDQIIQIILLKYYILFTEEVIAKELQFYRTECQYLNKLRLSQQIQVKQLQRQLQEEKETNIELANVLKTQKQEQLFNQTKTEGLNNITQKNEPSKISNRQHKDQFSVTQRQPLLPQTIKQMQLAPHLTIEIKNIKTPLLEHQDPKNLKELFHQCVQQLSRENQMRGNYIKKNKQICSRDCSGQFQICEEEKDVIAQLKII